MHKTSATLRIKRSADAGITPVYCIGETIEEHQAGKARAVINEQLRPLFELDADSIAKVKAVGLVIAYEPVWAIGGQTAATPEQAQSMHVYIRELVAIHDAKFANTMRIIYGGNLNSDNALSILTMPDIDGGLIGRASLGPETFKHICQKLVNITNQ